MPSQSRTKRPSPSQPSRSSDIQPVNRDIRRTFGHQPLSAHLRTRRGCTLSKGTPEACRRCKYSLHAPARGTKLVPGHRSGIGEPVPQPVPSRVLARSGSCWLGLVGVWFANWPLSGSRWLGPASSATVPLVVDRWTGELAEHPCADSQQSCRADGGVEEIPPLPRVVLVRS